MIRAIAWEGPSPLTGAPMTLVLTGPSQNRKTGPMVQAWLLCRDVNPFAAIASGADAAICGACTHRGADPGAKRTCYVSMFTGPSQIWKGLQAGRYPRLTLEATTRALAGHQVRVCAYGDPALLPYEFWTTALAHAGWVGYTHQHRTCDPRYRSLLMASVESEAEAAQAERAGWRTFRVRQPGQAVRANECVCPASDEAGHRTSCDRCRLCRGTAVPAKSIAILAHGKSAATRAGQPRSRYDDIRSDLTEVGYSVVATDAWALRETNLRLALRQHDRRRGRDRTLHVRTVSPGTLLLWYSAEAAS